jgi:dTDP-4-dehydrorhamnose reductase
MILITGADGQLGREITVRATGKGLLVRPLNRIGLDITDRRTVLDRVAESGARLVINAAAYNLVDRAETEPQAAHAVNADGPGHLAEACDAKGIPLIHISTDYVFGGEKNSPYTEDDPALPLSEYGRSKLAGEKNVRERLERHLIVRTAWLYGPHGRNFVTTMLRLAREREEIRVVNDQRGSPTAVPDLAEALLGLSENILAGRAIPWGT